MVTYEDLTDQQQRAVDTHDRNVTLTAGAGTGKTTTLTARYIAMIEQSVATRTDGGSGDDYLRPENILTTTFTERAATDLEESVRTEITDRIDGLNVEEFDAWRTVADELDQGYIHTLHGFCTRLLREHALTFDVVDPGFETLDQHETAALIHDTVGAVLEEYENHEVTQTLARRFSRSQLQDVLTDLLTERPESLEWADRWAEATADEYIAFVESALHPIDPAVAAERLANPDFVAAVDTLKAIVSDPPDIETGGQTWQRAEGVVEFLDVGFDDGVPSRSKQSTIAELSMHLTTGSGERYAGYTGATTRWGDHPQKVAFDNAFETLVDTLQPEEYAVNVDLEIEANSFPYVQALATLTQIAAAEYEDRKDRQNAVDFTDQISNAVDVLESPENAHIREELRQQFEYVMVDEFQDTDPRQWDLITLLTASDGDTFDAQNVFVVGDVKQSIYRFRNADVTQFRETATTLESVSQDARRTDTDSEDDDHLSTNFRTLPTVLDSVNHLFEAIFDVDGEPYEAAPQSLAAARDDPAHLGSVEYLAVPTNADLRAHRCGHYADFATADPEHDTELEAMALAARLSQILAEPLQVYPEPDEPDADSSERGSEAEHVQRARQAIDDDTTSPEPRVIEPNDIAILIRSRTHLKKYERALEDASIPYSVASGVGFYETREITALLNLFRALADPGDERALYATLRSPIFGFPDDTLAQLKLHDAPLWDALATSTHNELQDAYEYLTEWRHLAGLGDDGSTGFDGSWAAYLTRILEDTGYVVSVNATERPEQAMANIEKFREMLRGLSNDGVHSLTTLMSRIDRRIEVGGRESEADTTGDGVQILTIHDAKGMEFPFVVVPGIDREFKDEAALGGGNVEFEQIGGQHAVGMKASNPDDPFEMVDTIARETLRERRRAEERAEEKRVLYVACTRARDHLLLSGLHESAGETEELSMTDLAEADPDTASSWRDWVQPELLTEDVCTALDSDTHVDRTYGDGAYTVSLPTAPAEQVQLTPDIEPVVDLSQRPPRPDVDFQFTATDLASLFGEYGELQVDNDTGMIYVEAIDDNESHPEHRHGEAERTVGETDPAGYLAGESSVASDGSDARVFGKMVHRLCEVRPPEAQWANLMTQTLVNEGATVTLTKDLQDRVRAHARRGIAYVDEQTSRGDVEYQYDELYVTAEFDRGDISGFIDHLLVTPDAYHIIDYKTGNITPAELDADAAYYETQMKAYAIALHQQGTGRSVRVSLVFTSLDEVRDVAWSPDTLQSIQEEIKTEITDRIEKHLSS